MYYPQDYVGQLVRLRDLQRCSQFNGEMGRIMYPDCSNGRWVVDVLFRRSRPRLLALKGTNIELVNKEWQRTTGGRHGPFYQEVMIQKFGGPSRFPAPVSALRDIRSPPSKKILLSFWGKNVYEYMLGRLGPVMDACGNSRARLGLFQDFETCHRQAAIGMVYSDGTKCTQATPLENSNVSGYWWPVLMPRAQVPELEGYHMEKTPCRAIVVWCQAQAVSGSRPYHTHPDRVIVFDMPHGEPTEPEYTRESTVTFSDAGSDQNDTKPTEPEYTRESTVTFSDARSDQNDTNACNDDDDDAEWYMTENNADDDDWHVSSASGIPGPSCGPIR